MAIAAQSMILELEPGETIRGRLHEPAGEVHDFHGWLELSAAIERVWQRVGTDAGPSAPVPRARSGERT